MSRLTILALLVSR